MFDPYGNFVSVSMRERERERERGREVGPKENGDASDFTIYFQWHLGMFAEEYTPRRRGFDTHYGYYQGAAGYFDHTYEANEV